MSYLSDVNYGLDSLDVQEGDLVGRGGSTGIIVMKHDDMRIQVLWDDGGVTQEIVWRLTLLQCSSAEREMLRQKVLG